ncbi:MAG: hypothetical protein F6K22_34415 [Okeania sp. SIO2F4]|uniref:glucokinase n=1 Tax=Okeania sp. SIO2F4 TaxID=2607790 RepID=UPI00142B50C0|nr:glucokinase [Okeania sp. SIO2F4]NES07445.1 hypothetical protein [Okeania sp. SIO2F4]
MVILAGEISATKTKLALFTHKYDSALDRVVVDERILLKEFNTLNYLDPELENIIRLENIIEEFCKQHYNRNEHGHIYCVCLGVPAQVTEGSCEIQRSEKIMPLTEDACREKLPVPYRDIEVLPVKLINDMVAHGSRIVKSSKNDLEVLFAEKNESKLLTNRHSIMLVSDGLGNSLWQEDEEQKNPSYTSFEKGHERFAPQTDEEWELTKYIKGKIKEELERSSDKKNKPIPLDQIKVRFENVLSRQGLVRIYQFLKEGKKYGEGLPELTTENIEKNIDKATTIANFVENIIGKALPSNESQKPEPLCLASLEMMLKIWGRRAGDLAMGDEAEIISVGGISVDMEKLKDGIFVEAFLEKNIENSRNYKHNKDVSLQVFPEENSVLLGAAQYIAEDVPTGKFALMEMEIE